jgi:hypothetical protein
MAYKWSHFSACFAALASKYVNCALLSGKTHWDLAVVSRKCGGKMPFLRPQRKSPGTPRLWPHLAEIARLVKTVLSP